MDTCTTIREPATQIRTLTTGAMRRHVAAAAVLAAVSTLLSVACDAQAASYSLHPLAPPAVAGLDTQVLTVIGLDGRGNAFANVSNFIQGTPSSLFFGFALGRGNDRQLPNLPGGPAHGDGVDLSGVNTLGQAVGTAGDASSSFNVGTYWKADGAPIKLLGSNDPSVASFAFPGAINDAGIVAGGVFEANNCCTQAALWANV